MLSLGLRRLNRIVFVQDVDKLRRIEYLAAKLALDKLDVILTGDDPNLRMFARFWHKGRSLKKVCLCPIRLSIQNFINVDVFFQHHKVKIAPRWPPNLSSP